MNKDGKHSTRISTDGGAQVEGSVDTGGGGFVGRDQIIHNIVLVGRVLDLAQVEQLIPEPHRMSFTDVASALEEAFAGQQKHHLVEATAAAGEFLRDMVVAHIPTNPFAAIPLRRLLSEMAPSVIERLDLLGYWDTFREFEEFEIAGYGPGWEGYVIWLQSLSALWRRRFGDVKVFGIAEIANSEMVQTAYRVFVIRDLASESEMRLAHPLSALEPIGDRNNRIARMANEEIQVFLLGIIIDFIRLGSVALTGRHFWNEIVELLSPTALGP